MAPSEVRRVNAKGGVANPVSFASQLLLHQKKNYRYSMERIQGKRKMVVSYVYHIDVYGMHVDLYGIRQPLAS